MIGNNTIRVAFNARYLTEFKLRGFNRYTFGVLKALQRTPNIELYLFTDDRSRIHSDFLSELDAAPTIVPSGRVLLWEHYAVPRALRQRRIDVFHAPADGGVPWPKSCKYVLTYHDAADRGLAELARTGYLPIPLADAWEGAEARSWRHCYLKARHALFRQLYLRSADRIITVSEFSKRELVNLLAVPAEKIRVTHLAADEMFLKRESPEAIGAVRRKYGLPTSYILFVGSFDRRKNVAGLLNAYSALRSVQHAPPLVLVGTDGDVDAFRRQAVSLSLALDRDVFFRERIQEDLPGVYQGAVLFTTLAWKETFCFPAVEALASGLPVVAANTGAIPEIVGDAAVLVDPRRAGDVAAAIAQVLGDQSVRFRLQEKARQRSRLLSWSTVADKTIEVYQELLRVPGAKPWQ